MREGEKRLRSGYTTGVHTAAALYSAVSEYLNLSYNNQISIPLPNGQKAVIEAFGGVSVKGDNDDIDATKGCLIRVSVQNSADMLCISKIPHSPYILRFGTFCCYLYAGEGVGVVTKKGLKPPIGYPAVNPVPLSMIQRVLDDFAAFAASDLYVSVSVENGEEIAKQTANGKVGVIGGISILGSTGIVKPISNEAMLSSIEAEISVISNTSREIVFTIGNTAYNLGVGQYGEDICVEIGNFVYDTLQMLSGKAFRRLTFITGQGKCAKIAQGFKNTHNRYGDTDFAVVAEWLKEYGIDGDISDCGTIKGVAESLGKASADRFFELLKQKAKDQIINFLPDDSKDIDVCVRLSE